MPLGGKNMSKYNKDFLKELDKKLCLVPLTYDFSFKRIFANDNSTDHTILKMFLISVRNKRDRIIFPKLNLSLLINILI